MKKIVKNTIANTEIYKPQDSQVKTSSKHDVPLNLRYTCEKQENVFEFQKTLTEAEKMGKAVLMCAV